jgi:hypothetical protein
MMTPDYPERIALHFRNGNTVYQNYQKYTNTLQLSDAFDSVSRLTHHKSTGCSPISARALNGLIVRY